MKVKVYKSRISHKRYGSWKVERLTRKQAENELDKKGLTIKEKKISKNKISQEISDETVAGYCRIKNFKRIIQNMKNDREQFSEYLNQFVNAVTNTIEMEGGEFNRFSEDGILFYFRKSKGKKDYINRAVLSAYKIRYRMNKLNRKWQTFREDAWTVGIGINKGIADFKILDDSETLYGELAEIVKGLSVSAARSEILISEKIFNESGFDESLFQMKEPKHVPVHGKDYVLKVREIVGLMKDTGLI